MVYCQECYTSGFGADYLPPTIGRSQCEECGKNIQNAYENEDADHEECDFD